MSSFPLSALCVLTVRLQCGLSVHFGGAFLHQLLSLICLVCAHCATAMRPQCPLWRSFSSSTPWNPWCALQLNLSSAAHNLTENSSRQSQPQSTPCPDLRSRGQSLQSRQCSPPWWHAFHVAGGGAGAPVSCLCMDTCDNTAIPVPAIPLGAAVDKVPPMLLLTRTTEDNSTFGGGLWSSGS